MKHYGLALRLESLSYHLVTLSITRDDPVPTRPRGGIDNSLRLGGLAAEGETVLGEWSDHFQ